MTEDYICVPEIDISLLRCHPAALAGPGLMELAEMFADLDEGALTVDAGGLAAQSSYVADCRRIFSGALARLRGPRDA